MGSLTDLLGKSPRVAILEAFAEHPELEFSVPEIVQQTGVSKRGAYLHIAKLLDEGIISKGGKLGKCQYYKANEHDRRGEFLGLLESVFTLGKLEREVKRDWEILPDQPLVSEVRIEPPESEFSLWAASAGTDTIYETISQYRDVWKGVSPNVFTFTKATHRPLQSFMTTGTTANESPPAQRRTVDLADETSAKDLRLALAQ